MKTHIRVVCALLFAVLGTTSSVAAAATSVKGTVRDAEGNLLTHAYVEARPVTSKNAIGTVVGNTPNPWIAADSSGHFELSLPAGRYRIRAKDEIDGYPDPSFWLNMDRERKFPEIIVGDQTIEDVEVILGSRGAILSGEVQDAQTHKLLADAKIRIQDAKNSDAYVEIFTDRNGHFRYTVPSKPILISAAALGYTSTAFEGGAEVTLSPGEHRELELQLEHE